jgi:hypothetical protein
MLCCSCYPRELAKLCGYTSCFVVAIAVAVAVAVAVLYSMKQFENLPLQQGSHAHMQFGILPLQLHALQQGNSHRIHAIWYPATALQMTAEHLYAVLRKCRCSRAATCAPMQFGILPLHSK